MDAVDLALEPVFWVIEQNTALFGKFCGFMSDALMGASVKLDEWSDDFRFISDFVNTVERVKNAN